jgi:hypothetical protein
VLQASGTPDDRGSVVRQLNRVRFSGVGRAVEMVVSCIASGPAGGGWRQVYGIAFTFMWKVAGRKGVYQS